MTESLVLVEKSQGVATVLLNDPAKMNALSQPLAGELTEVLEQLRYDRTIKVVVLRGAGGNFSAGGNIRGMKERVDSLRRGEEPASDTARNLRNLNRLTSLVRSLQQPVVAWMEGAVAGGGLSLAMACDFSLADEACRLVFAFANIGLAPDMGSSMLMARRAGMPRATELFMLGSRFSGRQAADWGIITDAVPALQLETRVEELVKKLSAGPALSYAAVKAALNRVMYYGMAEAMEAEVESQSALSRSQDHGEAVTAFLEKRPPQFHGR